MSGYKDYPGVQDPPKDAKFTYPDGTTRSGTVVEEVRSGPWGTPAYLWVIQRIEWDGHEEPSIRFGYYRKTENRDRFMWGSQTSFAPLEFEAKELINNAAEAGIL